MDQDRVLEAFRLEAGELTKAVAGLSEAEWDRPTRCEPWSVRELLGHVRVVTAWLPLMLGTPAPDSAEVTAVEYYRPDDRFSPQTNTTRIDLARNHAAQCADGAALADGFAATWQQVDRLCRDQPENRVVRTRHGDAMLLSEFLITRVVELAVHGLDVAEALGCEPWLTAEAGTVVRELLLGSGQLAAVRELGWDEPTFLRKATGRAALDVTETARVERLGIQWLTLG
ncbi:maleylpyruvate isomerase N-terminal domain-containing protein [Streptomyces sp. NBS 14/10]|uniref:maleylpyruvate isomerase N-terminal domain-containing protein n=1 Tax=Streptomyces sp. NBS 14/10 TaxID=1945643 RepID=UPI000B7EEEBC|nr:maleylpyruvate isomerase N-terminal domain-containing protein [Streptomyces sp. NBS 14/10]KAK1178352.1 maleylpyruvate isomerase N-terminal domain-containing protein [Streptomyces sp. NBS 14/10]